MTPANAPVPLRRKFDFVRTSLRPRWKLHLASASLAIGTAGLLSVPFGFSASWAAAFAGFILGLVAIVPEITSASRGQIELRQSPPTGFSSLSIGNLQRVTLGTEVCVVDEDVDRLLPSSPATVRWSSAPYRLPASISRHAYDVLRQTASSPNIFNGRVVRQDEDLTSAILSSGGSIGMRKTDYFALKCTNYLLNWRVFRKGTNELLLDGGSLISDAGRLRSMAESELANSICASTLAFTSDGKAILILQSAIAESSNGRLAPSGSGSVDLRDVRGIRWHRRRKLLTSVVRDAMERELCEEAHVRKDEIDWTEVIGYYRWLNMGGKPEYSGITQLNVSSVELRDRSVRWSETRFVKAIFFGDVDLSELKRNPTNFEALHSNAEGILSVPLAMCLRSLGLAIARGGDFSMRLSGVAST